MLIAFKAIGDVELLHEPQKVWVVAFGIAGAALPALPDLPQSGVVQDTVRFSRSRIFEHIADSLSQPLRVQNDDIA
jgi:hypothetical protein